MKLSLRSTTKHLIFENKAFDMFDLLGCSVLFADKKQKQKKQIDSELK